MRLKIQIIFLLMALSLEAYSQISVPGKPLSYSFRNKSAVRIPIRNLEFIDTAALRNEDRENSISNRYGVVQHFKADIKKDGLATNIDGKGTIWQYEIKSDEAISLGIRFSVFHLPEGASVFIYNEARKQLAGSFTSIDNLTNKQLPIADFKGGNAIIEYFEPLNPEFPGEIVIGSVALAYKNALLNGITRIGINCPEGADWQDVKHAVCLMSFNDSLYLYYCTGFLINNVREDGTAYFQTASHCLHNNSMASTLVTYFNFEQPICSVDTIIYSPSLAGATVISYNAYSDFSLLKLSQYPPNSYLPYYAGWNANIIYPQKGTCIHHPSRLPKCISLDTIAPRNYPFPINWQDTSDYPISEPGTNWEVLFTYGTIEGGSSGAPLFNENKLVIGQLHGGSNTDGFFGKFSLSWDYNGSIFKQLRYWLDPDSSGVRTLEGSFIPKKPVASFSVKSNDVCNGAILKLRDFSLYAPKKWLWKISPSSGYYYVNGTDSASMNPQLQFPVDGKYSVTLICSNEYGSDTLSKIDYIYSINIHSVLSGIPENDLICGCNLINFPIASSDAISYKFSVERNDKISLRVNNDSAFLSLKASEKKYGSFNSWVKVVGMNRSCISTDSVKLQINMPVNDDIENAIKLSPGSNSEFSNFCASIESNEPFPPASSCYSSSGWCIEDADNSSNLNNTIWFWFRAPSNGITSIDTHGFDDRIAIYEADSAKDILSGNPDLFNLIAANDNRSSSDPTAFLHNISLKPFKIYWLQVDGHKNETGSTSIDLLGNSINISPNPNAGIFKIVFFSEKPGNAYLQIHNTQGAIVYTNEFPVTATLNQFNLVLTTLPAGLYILDSTINGIRSSTKLVVSK